jgi:hypothetical protein
MSIIDPRKGNEIRRPKLLSFFCSHPPHPSHSAASAIQPEITLFHSPPTLFFPPRRQSKSSKKGDCPHTILSEQQQKKKKCQTII